MFVTKSSSLAKACKSLMFLAMLSFLTQDVVYCASDFRQIAIPKEEHGYSQLDSQVVSNPEAFNKLIKNVESQNSWNEKSAFLNALKNAKVNLARESLVFIRNTEGSGSTQVSFSTQGIENKQLICKISRKKAEIGTMNMAYYCFALAIDKNAISNVLVHTDGKPDMKLSIN